MSFESFATEPDKIDADEVSFEALPHEEGDLPLATRIEMAKESTEGLVEQWLAAIGVLDAYKAVYQKKGAVVHEAAQAMLDAQQDKLRAIEQLLGSREDALKALDNAVAERKSVHEGNISQGFNGTNLMAGYEADLNRFDTLKEKLEASTNK